MFELPAFSSVTNGFVRTDPDHIILNYTGSSGESNRSIPFR